MNILDETHIIHSCYAAVWEGSEEHHLNYQGRQLCDDKQAPSVLLNFKLIVRCTGTLSIPKFSQPSRPVTAVQSTFCSLRNSVSIGF